MDGCGPNWHNIPPLNMEPIVSVVLPVYNCPQYVGEAIDSILGQTFGDFELIVIDDGSTDATPDVVRGFSDPRIHFIVQANMGLPATLNRGIESARGRYVARQDQDDISLPQRFEKQVSYLDAHPRCGLVGTWAEIWHENTKTHRAHRHAGDSTTLKFELMFNNPFVHSSVMLRKDTLQGVGGYSTDSARQPPEDYELWSRIAREYDVANIPEALQIYREVDSSMSRADPSPFLDHLVTLCAENIAWRAGMNINTNDIINIAALAHRAEYRIIGAPDFSVMRHVLLSAVAALATGNERARLERKAKARLNTLRYNSMELRHKDDVFGSLLRAGRRISSTLRRR
jgi:glycosyltransferase involved in cell wall biosynthesis